MDSNEMMKCLEEIRELYPKFNVSETASRYWFDLCGRKYTRREFMSAVRKHVEVSEFAPNIANLNGLLRAMFKRDLARRNHWDRDYQVIDFCMDMLGPDFVIDELKTLVGAPQTVKWAALVARKEWVPQFKRAKKQLWDVAVQRWLESGPPEKRFFKEPGAERDWDLIGAPHFVAADFNITPQKRGDLRVPYELVDGYVPPAQPIAECL